MLEWMLNALKQLRPSHIAIIAAAAIALVAGGIAIGTAVNDDGGRERIGAPFGRDAGGPDPRGFRRGGPGGPGFYPGKGGPHRGGPGFNPNVRQVLFDVKQAIAKQSPKIADPILDKAVKDKKISKAEADTIRQRLDRVAQGGGPGHGGF